MERAGNNAAGSELRQSLLVRARVRLAVQQPCLP